MFWKFIRYTLCVLLLVSCFSLYAQQRTISGKITDQVTGKPMPDATVNVKGATQTVTTA